MMARKKTQVKKRVVQKSRQSSNKVASRPKKNKVKKTRIKKKPASKKSQNKPFRLSAKFKKTRVTLIRKKTPATAVSDESTISLPNSYNETRLVLLVRDPMCLYSYWDFSAETWNWIQQLYQTKAIDRVILRVKDLNASAYKDFTVNLESKSWYLHLDLPDTEVEAELGLLDRDANFYLIARSNRLKTPRNGPSKNTDPDWLPYDYDEIYKLSGGPEIGHGSEIFSPVRKN